MLYVLTFGGDPLSLETLPPDEAVQARAELEAWWRHNRRVGRVLLGMHLMAPLTATTIRFVGGRPVLHDGPFTPEPEAIGGYGIIAVADLDAALALASSWPAGGYVEVRPLLSPRTLAEVVRCRRQTTEGGEHQ